MSEPTREYPDPDRPGFRVSAKLQAHEELRRELFGELFDAAVEAERARLRAQSNQSLWQRLLDKLPFTITIRRKQP